MLARFSRRAASWLGLGVLASALIAAVLMAPGPAEDRALAIGSRIRCPVCQGDSIADSPSESARNMMDLVRTRIDQGDSDEEIIAELLSSYSGALLLDPPVGGPTLWLWLAPLVALLVGLVMIRRRFRLRASPEVRASPLATSGRTRWVVGAVLVLAGAVVVGTIGQFRQSRPEDQSLAGVAGEGFDPDSISNETMEAVIAAEADNPQINGMRLALADRYFDEGDYQNAFAHYQAVLDSEPAAAEAAAAYTRLGWMVYDGNGETDLGLELIERALALVPEDAFALYLKGRVTWCGKDDAEGAAEIFDRVLTTPGLDSEVRTQVAADLETAASGASCP
ncbi:MAG TPA: cytochrome c-type biogenesis protein CcmH [Acidimicrobiia bacterium]|nr:cytochrome c-type biogenesis protein CcmH [Acidimicrobiia bacterium]